MYRAILLIDTDLGFLFWLGSALDHAGFQAFPARCVPDAINLLAELRLTVGALIVNLSLPNAEEFVARMRQSSKHLKIISLVEHEEFVPPTGIDGVCAKPAEVNDRSRAALVQTIHRILSPHLAESDLRSSTRRRDTGLAG